MANLLKPVLIVSLAISVSGALAACGARAPLEPLASNELPPVPYGEAEGPDAEQLLELPTLAAPERSVELRRRSEEREDDPFDLPPD
ncbi:argininosuccinate lyase [Erythrobacter longus]|uniref:Argininosuccinate lyase n=1 Tax=Erythrobacter longus TaxID=1044 RepID=A0A074MZ96_ERYLO|nr:hypothetical protein [Erythrobacter longus]KEO90962.1 argininosuccinate lyase [Erythrobacter longus]